MKANILTSTAGPGTKGVSNSPVTTHGVKHSNEDQHVHDEQLLISERPGTIETTSSTIFGSPTAQSDLSKDNKGTSLQSIPTSTQLNKETIGSDTDVKFPNLDEPLEVTSIESKKE